MHIRARKKMEKGAVAFEFIILFPFVIGLIYAAAVYGALFSWQVRMQVAVDRATASVMRLDRSGTAAFCPLADGGLDVGCEAEFLANKAMSGGENGAGLRPDFIGSLSGTACKSDKDTGQVICTLKVEMKDEGCDGVSGAVGSVEALKTLGFFGGFPPMPGCLQATSKVSY